MDILLARGVRDWHRWRLPYICRYRGGEVQLEEKRADAGLGIFKSRLGMSAVTIIPITSRKSPADTQSLI